MFVPRSNLRATKAHHPSSMFCYTKVSICPYILYRVQSADPSNIAFYYAMHIATNDC